jgi:hypothetical protein
MPNPELSYHEATRDDDPDAPQPGALRLRSDSALAVATNVEVLQQDGRWLKLLCVTSVDLSIKPDDFIRAQIGVIPSQIDVVAISALVRPSLWQRIRERFHYSMSTG